MTTTTEGARAAGSVIESVPRGVAVALGVVAALAIAAAGCGPKRTSTKGRGDGTGRDDDWGSGTAAAVPLPVDRPGPGIGGATVAPRYAPGESATIGFAAAREAFRAGDYATAAAGMRGVVEGKVPPAPGDLPTAAIYLAAADLRIDPGRAGDEAKRAAGLGADAALVAAYRALAGAAQDGGRVSAGDGGAAIAARLLKELGDGPAAVILASADDGAPADPALEAEAASLGWTDADLAVRLGGGGQLGGWIQLRYATLLYHTRAFEAARKTYADYLTRFPGHPGAARATEMIGRLDARDRVDRRKVGVLLPLTGKFEKLGAAAKVGIEIALDAADVTLVVKDTAGEEAKARAAAEELVLKENVIAIVGPIGSKETAAAAAKAEEYGVPILTLDRSEDVTALGSWVFRMRSSNEDQARAVARAAIARYGLKRFGIFYPVDDYGSGMMRAFWDEVVKNGGEITAVEGYVPGTRDFSGEVKRLVGTYYLEPRARDIALIKKDLKEKTGSGAYAKMKLDEAALKELEPMVDFDGLFIPEFADELKFILPYLNAERLEFLTRPDRDAATLKKKHRDEVPPLVTLLGAGGWTSSPKMFSEKTGERLREVATNSIFVDTFYEAGGAEASAFGSAYHSRAGKKPDALAAQAHDAGAALAEALKRLGAKADRTELRTALAGIRDLPLACGKLTMMPNRTVARDLVLLTVEDDGKIVTRDAYEAARAAPKADGDE